jgi:carboxylesterase type B
VYAPLRANASSTATTEPLKPVMVFIYGGRFWSGATQGTAYDSRFLANQSGAVLWSVAFVFARCVRAILD